MANEKRLIDANALISNLRTFKGLGRTVAEALVRFTERQPTVDAVEVVHGKWIERPLDNFRKYEVKCLECGFIGIGNYDQYLEPSDFNYCPNCGAKMDADAAEQPEV